MGCFRVAAVFFVSCVALACTPKGTGTCPAGQDCSTGVPVVTGCQKDSDCGDGLCNPDGTCRDRYSPGTQTTACANLTCPAGDFCANGVCLPDSPQCQAADASCIYVPHGSFEPPMHAWWWPWLTPDGPEDKTGHIGFRADLDYPKFTQVMSTPVVMRLHPKDVEPAVVFNSFSVDQANIVETQGVMRAIHGSDGSPIWTAPHEFATDQTNSVDGNASIAAGDCMGTGEVCFITGGWDPNDVVPPPNTRKSHQHGGLIAFGNDGRLLWLNRDPKGGASGPPQIWWGAPAIARLLGPTGPAQVVVGNGVYDGATGKTLCAQSVTPLDQVGGNGDGTETAIADIDLDGIPEVVTGNQAYKLLADSTSPTGYVCKAMFGAGVKMPGNQPCGAGFGPACPDGFLALGNFAGYGATMGLSPTDPHPQIVVVSRGYLRIQDWTGGMLQSPIALPADASCNGEYNQGGSPTIADFDGDGLPEIGIAAQGAYVVWKPGKGFIWSQKTRDCSANTGSSVFDFEGKGQAKVVYSDQCFFRIYDGTTGAPLIEEKNSTCTAYEMPVVADIDGTGRAKVLVPNNVLCNYYCPDWPGGPGYQSQSNYSGLKALASPTDKWVNTRSVWNEHTYHVSNVNLDGTLPWPEPDSWAPGQSNSYRQNVQGKGVFSSPFLTSCEVKVDMTDCRTGKAKVTATIYNGGALVAKAGVHLTFTALLENGQTALLGQAATTKQLLPGDSEEVVITWPEPPQSQTVSVRVDVDPDHLIGSCRPSDNFALSTPVRCVPPG